MTTERTRCLIHEGFNSSDPKVMLIQVLDSVTELINLPDNDFAWSSWESAKAARDEIQNLTNRIEKGDIPKNLEVSIIFAPTGPLQEISLSSGWADTFLKVAERFDEVDSKLWK